MKFTEDHEWLDANDEIVTVGITKHAADALGDLVFVELPDVGDDVSKGDEIAVIESVKAASGIEAPLDGEITEINEALVTNPAMVNEDPQGGAWFFKIKATDLAEMDDMMDEDAYKEHVG